MFPLGCLEKSSSLLMEKVRFAHSGHVIVWSIDEGVIEPYFECLYDLLAAFNQDLKQNKLVWQSEITGFVKVGDS